MRERLLGAELRIHGVDVEHVASKALSRTLHKLGGHLDEHEREDALAYVISEVWRASLDFDPKRGNFRARANFVASRRLADWFRKRYGRTRWTWSSHTYERERRSVLSLDAPASSDTDIRLGDVVAERASDREADPDALGARDLLVERARHRARDFDALDLEPPQRAA